MINDQKLLCFFCFEKLQNAFTAKNQDLVFHIFSRSDLVLQLKKIPIFVSWYVNGDLRGNVGCFEDIQITNGLTEYSITAAMKDWRYSPISRSEFFNLKCTVSILQNYEEASNLNDWEKGTHGIRIFINGYTATLFPNEMERDKTKEEIIYELLNKAGFPKEEINNQKIQKAQIKRFKVFSVSADWDEYLKFIEETRTSSLPE